VEKRGKDWENLSGDLKIHGGREKKGRPKSSPLSLLKGPLFTIISLQTRIKKRKKGGKRKGEDSSLSTEPVIFTLFFIQAVQRGRGERKGKGEKVSHIFIPAKKKKRKKGKDQCPRSTSLKFFIILIPKKREGKKENFERGEIVY